MKKTSKGMGRVKLVCKRCQAEFSTHSSNRDVCHKCKPKCRETHYFDNRVTDSQQSFET